MIIGKVAPTITSFLMKSRGTQLKDVLVRATPDGIAINQGSQDKYRVVRGTMQKKCAVLVEWKLEQPQLIPVVDFEDFLKLLDSFSDLVEISVEGADVNLKSESRSLRYRLVAPEYIRYAWAPEEKNAFEAEATGFEVPLSFLATIKSDIGATKAKSLVIDLSGDTATVTSRSGASDKDSSVVLKERFKIPAVQSVVQGACYDPTLLTEVLGVLSEEKVHIGFHQIGKPEQNLFALSFRETTEDWFFVNYLCPAQVVG